ncbi:ABC transporter [Massilia arenosa]|uniref:ABC transporter n=1 Tax=Zemynaea arenosa TaxID=2561931 RepID=A0A4Y9SJQ3_9BURK|nr:ABC-type transport auxiliary lipoprotein family protein [Massilia arenosa]TFW22581.1 ABC transporter [Massilia arenosa]
MKRSSRLLSLLVLSLSVLLAGCGSASRKSVDQYDFGPLPDAGVAGATMPSSLPAIVIPDVTGPAWLDTQTMVYRLNYADPLQARPYTASRWSATPLQLITQRLKSRIAQSGARVLSTTDASAGELLLRIEVDDFSHTFDSNQQNVGSVVLRASLFDGRKFLDQKTFVRKTPSTSADAAGGVRALAASTDAVAADIMAWISSLPLRRP